MDQNKKKKQPNKWLALINIPIQMGIIIFAGVFFGNYLDAKFNLSPLFIILFSLISIFISLYSIFRNLKKIQATDND
ncbi:AtpZ/AtpI family protein [Flavobacterium gelidilacus]|uniref:AtpZ/AtpI family protein n=1 Tax=Flavobacterium gelidilacus TaxID=206041 RepID=UPI00047D36E4|nr:AtpZ/AtpI family protein [Flavobacterium gelidilacus]